MATPSDQPLADPFAADPLPIDAVLAPLKATLAATPAAVLVAPPGAGKTTRVPLALRDEPWVKGDRILVLEPRRLAARAAAARMAATLGERVGETVGFRVRLQAQVSAATRIEVITEGIFTRMVLADPELSGVAAVLFDEFHERSLDADLGLALALDAQRALREELRVLVMSATLDGARIAALLGADGPAPVIESEGRAFPVETSYLGRDPRTPVPQQVADAILRALREEAGSVLAFLPGAGEIRRTETLLAERLSDPMVDVVPLYGALDARTQDQAVAPAPRGRRKVVLATSIAETSLTIEGVRVVVDGGLARVPRFEPDVGVTRLETVRVSRAAADQRRGRAGRTAPGVCYRLWSAGETASLMPFAAPEILAAALSGMVLALAEAGIRDPAGLVFLDPPPAPALAEAKALLARLGALDADGAVTAMGRRMAQLPLPPRLAHMVVAGADRGAGRRAAEIAAVLTERGLGGDGADLSQRLDGFARDRSGRAEDARRLAAGWAGRAGGRDSRRGARGLSDAGLLALAFPDRIARVRTEAGPANGGQVVRFLLANGRGAVVEASSPLARSTYLAVADLTGTADAARILLAAPLAEAELEAEFADAIGRGVEASFDAGAAAVRVREGRRLGALVPASPPLPAARNADTARLLAQGLAALGIARLPWTPALLQWRDRVMFLRAAEGVDWPDLADAALAAGIEDWLAPYLAGAAGLADISSGTLQAALSALLPHALSARLEAEAPTHFTAPTGSRLPVDYGAEGGPMVAVRVQELFGLTRHPAIAGGRVPLTLSLLSPAHRPIQVTRDLPQFWTGSWREVRAEMRGRYPKHPWPEDPAAAPPTTRTKARDAAGR